MPPKKNMPALTPVKIGFLRKAPGAGTPSANSEPPAPTEEDVTTPIFSHSMMNTLEDMVAQEGIGEVVEGVEIEVMDEVDPDDPPVPVARQSTKRSLFSNLQPSTSKAVAPEEAEEANILKELHNA